MNKLKSQPLVSNKNSSDLLYNLDETEFNQLSGIYYIKIYVMRRWAK